MVCVLLLGVWVRSHYTEDVVSSGGPRFSHCMQSVSGKGKIKVQFYKASPRKAYWEWLSMPFAGRTENKGAYSSPAPIVQSSFAFTKSTSAFAVTAPYWFYILTLASLSVAPWIHLSKRFSLRTLLFATTIVAVLLGLIAVASR